MMTPHKDFPSDYLMNWSIVDDGMSSKLLTAIGAPAYNYNAETYPKLLNTFPKIVEVPEEKRRKFFERVSEIVNKHGAISVPVLTTLIICKKRNGFLKAISHPEG